MDITNSPAFPCIQRPDGIHQGITMLDYFAAKAMQAGITYDTAPDYVGITGKSTAAIIADDAYLFAAAMLEARKSYIK